MLPLAAFGVGWVLQRAFNALEPARRDLARRVVAAAGLLAEHTGDTGARDLTIPATLMQTFDHADCGIYARVIAAGDIAPGDTLTVSP